MSTPKLLTYTPKVDISTGDDELWEHACAISLAIRAARMDAEHEMCCALESYHGNDTPVKLPDVPVN